MLVIRQKQMDALKADAVRQFAERMAAHLRRTFPDRFARTPEADLRARVRRSIDEAAGFGVESEQDLQTYLECGAVLGFGFAHDPDHPEAGAILRTPELSGPQKMDLVS